MTTTTRRLRELLARDETLLMPFTYDGFTARIAEEAGFDAVYMSGFGTAMSKGMPDVGLLTQTEMVQNAAYVVEAVEVPVIADADTGYGNAINVQRTIRAYERVGVAGVHIEDQVAPKKCGFFDGKQVIDAGEAAAKVRAAVEARRDDDFVVIARCDALTVNWLGTIRNAAAAPTPQPEPTSYSSTASAPRTTCASSPGGSATSRACTTASFLPPTWPGWGSRSRSIVAPSSRCIRSSRR